MGLILLEGGVGKGFDLVLRVWLRIGKDLSELAVLVGGGLVIF